MESLEIQLERVQKAIAAIESGAQSYQIANRKIARADGGDLYFAELGRL